MSTKTRPIVNLYECDGNAFAILARVRTAFREANRSSEWEAFRDRMTSGDYDHLLATIGTECDVVWQRPRPWCPECGGERLNSDGECPDAECGHVDAEEECVECHEHFPASELNHNSYCSDCEWDVYWSEQDEAEDDEEDED